MRAYSAPVGGPQLAPRSTQHSTPVTHPHATSTLYLVLLAAGEGLGAISRARRAFGAVPILPQFGSCNRRLWSLTWQVASTRARAWAESLHVLDVYHTLDLADACTQFR